MNSPLNAFLHIAFWLGINGNALAAEKTHATNTFKFRLPHSAMYEFQPKTSSSSAMAGVAKDQWLQARMQNGSTNFVEFGSRVVVQLKLPRDLPRLMAGHALQLSRAVTENVFILQAPDATTAACEAARLAALPEVLASYPVVRNEAGLDGPYTYKPNATYFSLYQYYLENRKTDGSQRGADINVRAAWPFTRGAGVTVALGDTGFELDHPDLKSAANGAPHYNFEIESTNGAPLVDTAIHGTAVAGFISARATNVYSILGVSPESKLASWVVIGTNGLLVADDRLMEAFQYKSNEVQVQNHSWGEQGNQLVSPTLLTSIGISNALTFGRDGRGVIITRSAGNSRANGGNVNDNGYRSDPRVIAVASVRVGGRAASYSNPGACVLVSAVGGDPQDTYEFTTDRQGALGYNSLHTFSDYDFWNFTYNFYGTSAAAPQIAGIAALMLSMNPELTYRDVQQILILSARHFDLTDPDLVTNGAGLLVSHNAGFGIPDAGVAVMLALGWPNRPALTNVTLSWSNVMAIPDDGLRLRITGSGVPTNLDSIQTVSGFGPHADSPTATLPMVDFGYGTNLTGFDLTNKAALIQRQGAVYAPQINLAAQAGAAFVVFYNFTNINPSVQPLAGTDFVPIPAVFINQGNGNALKDFIATNNSALAQIQLNSTSQVFSVTNTLLCEHVGLRVMTDHPSRGDLRITLVSPAGTRSVLQRLGLDTNAGPVDWTYYSTHHFYESSAGDWTAYFSDEAAGATGSVLSASLIIYGTPITDNDHDGLDDNWEFAHFHNLAQGPKKDPDDDGYSNIREFLMGTDPNEVDVPFTLDLSRWDQNLARLSWPGRPGFSYEISGGTNADSLTVVTNIPTRLPETEWFTSYVDATHKFFRVQAIRTP